MNVLVLAEAVANAVFTLPSRRLRVGFARYVLRWPMGTDVQIGRRVQLQHVRGIELGNRVCIHRRTELDLRGGIKIGDDVAISPGCRILTADHDPQSPTREYRERAVVIGNRVWLATGATVMPGSTLGEGVVLGGGAVAHGRLDPWAVYAGNPATRVKDRAETAQTRLEGQMLFLQ